MLFGLLLTLGVAGSAYGGCDKQALDKCNKLTRMTHQWTSMTRHGHNTLYCTDEVFKCEEVLTCGKEDETLYMYQASIIGRLRVLKWACRLTDEDMNRSLREIECVQKNGLYDYAEGQSTKNKLRSMDSCSEYKALMTASHQAIKEKCGQFIADTYIRAEIYWTDPLVVAHFDDPTCALGDWEDGA